MPKTPSKKKKSVPQAETDTPPVDETPENLDKVRDILFGGQMRAVDQRLASLEKRFQRDLENHRSETAKRHAELEKFIKKEVESLTKKVQNERAKRTESLKSLSAELQDSVKSVEDQIAKLDDTSSKADADLRTAILEHTQSVAEQLTSLSDELSSELRQAVLDIRGEKLDTSTLVQVLSDMALHLSEDLQAETE